MRLFKKVLAVGLAIGMAFAAAACETSDPGVATGEASGLEGPHGLVYAEEQTLRTLYDQEVVNWSPFGASASANDWNATRNTTEGLMGVDIYGNVVPGLAESYTVNEDNTVYTFKLREGLQYVNHEKEPVGEMVAQDFVTVAEYICNPESAITNYTFNNVIVGAQEYNEGLTDDFSTVGYKALDDYTLEVTLVRPIPYWTQQLGSYFCTLTSYLNEIGEEYGLDHTKLLNIGPYVLTDFQPQYRRVYEKNPYYWDAENVHIERVVASYNAEMATIAPEMFMRGEVDNAAISAEIIDQWMTNPETAPYVIPALPDASYQYFYSFCYAPNPDAVPEVDNYLLAIDNEAFRQSLYWGLNRQRAIKGLDPYESGEMRLVNTIVAPSWANDKGVPYTEFGELKEISARPNWQFDAEKALAYRDQAIEELTAEGATFPVKLLMPYNPVTAGWSQEIEIVSQQLTDLFGADYIEFIIEAGPSVGFLADVRRTGSYGWMKLNMGGDYHDPQAFTVAFDENNSWTFLQNCETPKVRALHDEYLALLNAAKEIVDDNVARFEAFAKAEAFLLNHALVAPYTSDVTTVGYFAARTNYLESFSSPNDDRYFKGMRVLTEPLTSDQFQLLYEDWLAAKEASLQ